jgi:hypothetical protein
VRSPLSTVNCSVSRWTPRTNSNDWIPALAPIRYNSCTTYLSRSLQLPRQHCLYECMRVVCAVCVRARARVCVLRTV